MEHDVSKSRIIQEIANIAFLDPGNLFDKKGNLLELHKMTEGTRRAIADIHIQEIYDKYGDHAKTATRVKLENKLKALELLGNTIAMFTKNVKLEGGDTPIKVEHTADYLDLEERIKQIVGDALDDHLQ